jgi:hypothetical protein
LGLAQIDIFQLISPNNTMIQQAYAVTISQKLPFVCCTIKKLEKMRRKQNPARSSGSNTFCAVNNVIQMDVFDIRKTQYAQKTALLSPWRGEEKKSDFLGKTC